MDAWAIGGEAARAGIGALATALPLGAIVVGAASAADATLPSGTALTRVAATITATLAILLGLGQLLLMLGVLSPLALALPLAIGLGLRARFGAPRPYPWAEEPLNPALVLVAAWAALVVARGLMMPPTAWDDLTYHLPKVARFVQSGSWNATPGPGALGYYGDFARGGEVIWAWFALGTRDDTFVLVGPLLVTAAIPFAGAFAAESLDLPGPWEVGLLLVACPAVLGYGNAAYVDNLTLLTFLLATGFVARAVPDDTPVSAGLAGLAFGVGVAAKPVLLPLLFVAVPFVAARRPRWAVVLLAASIVGAPHYLDQWARHGSPVWPFAAAGFRGHPENVALMAGELEGGTTISPLTVLVAVFLLAPPFDDRTVNVGFVGLIVPVLAAIGVWRGARARPWATGLLLSFALAITANLLAPGVRAQLTLFVINVTRLILPLWASLVLLAASGVSSRWVWRGLTAIAFLNGLPRVFLTAELFPDAAVLAALFLVAWATWAWPRAGWLAIPALGALIGALRAPIRAPVYAETASGDATFWHRFADSGRAVMQGSAAWSAVDDGAAHTVAFAQGWDGLGISGFVLPWFGRHWQNRVIAIPTPADGAFVDVRVADPASQDASAWACRLVAAGVDRVVTVPPEPIEATWATSRPEAFPPLARAGGTRVFGVVPALACPSVPPGR